MFSGSIYENISRKSVGNKKKAQEAAQITNAHDFITRLPQGYDTVMLERGANFIAWTKTAPSFCEGACC